MIKRIWEKSIELKKIYEEFIEEELRGIPEEALRFLENGKLGTFDFEKFPTGYGLSHSWAGYDGTLIEGEFLVIRNGGLRVIEFKNNIIKYSDNGVITGKSHSHWTENLVDGDVIIAIYIKEITKDFNGMEEIEEKEILLERPYIYMAIRPEEATRLKEKFREWVRKMAENI